MDNAQALEIMRSGLIVAVKLCAPILLLSMAVGVIISILQAATQIHEQTITFVPKLIVVALVCLLCGSWMAEVLKEFTQELFLLML